MASCRNESGNLIINPIILIPKLSSHHNLVMKNMLRVYETNERLFMYVCTIIFEYLKDVSSLTYAQ